MVKDDIDRTGCSHVFCDVDANTFATVGCEDDHATDMFRANVIGILSMCDVAQQKNVHVSTIVMGCMFTDDTENFINDKPTKGILNYHGSLYPEKLLRPYANVLQLGVYALLDGDLRNPQNLITKISNYSKVSHIPNFFTVVEEFLPSAIDAALRGGGDILLQGAFPKMDQMIFDLNTTIGYKANQSDVDEMEVTLNTKANQEDVDVSLSLKANQADTDLAFSLTDGQIDAVNALLGTEANQVDMENTATLISVLDTALSDNAHRINTLETNVEMFSSNTETLHGNVETLSSNIVILHGNV